MDIADRRTVCCCCVAGVDSGAWQCSLLRSARGYGLLSNHAGGAAHGLPPAAPVPVLTGQRAARVGAEIAAGRVSEAAQGAYGACWCRSTLHACDYNAVSHFCCAWWGGMWACAQSVFHALSEEIRKLPLQDSTGGRSSDLSVSSASLNPLGDPAGTSSAMVPYDNDPEATPRRPSPAQSTSSGGRPTHSVRSTAGRCVPLCASLMLSR